MINLFFFEFYHFKKGKEKEREREREREREVMRVSEACWFVFHFFVVARFEF